MEHGRFSVLAFLCGFTAITLQTALIRVVGLSVGSSEYAFALVLAVFVAMLALGAAQISRKSKLTPLWLNQLAAALGLCILYFSIPSWPYVAHVLRVLFAPVEPSFYLYHGLILIALATVTAVVIPFMGRSMPLMFGLVGRRMEKLGQDVGSLYFVNTLGCVAGAVVGGFWIYYWADLDQVLKLVLALLFASSAWAAFCLAQRPHRYLTAALAAVALAVFFVPRWDPIAFKAGTFRARQVTPTTFSGPKRFYQSLEGELIYRRDGPTSSVGILESHENGERSLSIMINGKSDGSTGRDLNTEILMAHLPALFATTELDDVAVIGLGTGITAGSLSIYPEVKAVHVFEMSPLAPQFAAFFDQYDHQLSASPKLRWHLGDAFQELKGDRRKYALIASEPSNPWVTGVERLYSKEFLTLAASRLKPGGVYAQWFHDYDLSLSTVGLVINTFHSAFKEVRLFSSTRGDLVILGANDGDWSKRFDSLERELAQSAVHEDLHRIGIENAEAILAREVEIPIEFFADYGEHSLEFPKLSYRAALEFFLRPHTDMLEVEESPMVKSWAHRFSDRPLTFHWLRRHLGSESLARMTEAMCGGEVDLNKQSARCQQYSVRLALVRGQDLSHKLSPVQNMVVDLLSSRTPRYTIHSAAEASIALKFLEALDSPPLRAKKELLTDVAKSCFQKNSQDELNCRMQLSKNLAILGDTRGAYAIYSELKSNAAEVSAEDRKEAIDAILESSRMNAKSSDRITD